MNAGTWGNTIRFMPPLVVTEDEVRPRSPRYRGPGGNGLKVPTRDTTARHGRSVSRKPSWIDR